MLPYRVLVLSDQSLFCVLLGQFLREHDFIIEGEYTDTWKAVEYIRKSSPDIVLIDARRAKANGLEDASILKGEFPAQKVVILSASDEMEDITSALLLKIDGYLLKNSSVEQIVQDLKDICNNELRISPKLVGVVLKAWHQIQVKEPKKETNTSPLSPRENEILSLIAKGKTNKEIGQQLLISPNTVKNHVDSILTKLNVHSRSEAVYTWIGQLSNRQRQAVKLQDLI